jgi:hypothetical protein
MMIHMNKRRYKKCVRKIRSIDSFFKQKLIGMSEQEKEQKKDELVEEFAQAMLSKLGEENCKLIMLVSQCYKEWDI